MSDYDTIARDQIKKRIFEVLAGKIPGNVLLEQALLAEQAEDEAEATATGTDPAAAVRGEVGGVPGQGAHLRAPPGSDPGAEEEEAAPEQVVDEEATKAATEARKQEILAQAAIFENGPDLIQESDAAAIASAIYDATKAAKWSNLGTGAGTDEEGLRAALKRVPTQMDLSFVSWVFEQKYGDAWSFTPTLEAVFESELDDRDMYDIVEITVREMPVLSISGKKYTLEDFNKLSKESVALVSAGTDPTDASAAAMKVAGGAAATAAAGTAAVATVGAGIGLAAAGTFGATASTAAIGTALGGSMAAGTAGLGAAYTGAATTLGALGPPGWAVLGVAALGVGVYMMLGGDSTMDEAVAGALNSENYQKMQKFFESTAANFKAQAKALPPQTIYMPAPEPEEEEVPEEGTEEEEGTTYAALPFRGLSAPVVKNIQITMNEYCVTRGISEEMIEEDGQWGPETQSRWENEFAGHVLDNHSVISNSQGAADITDADLTGKGSWKNVSKALIGEFPGYNSSQTGCLAFCVDGYNDNTRFGDRRQRRGGGGREHRGGSGGGADRGPRQAAAKAAPVVAAAAAAPSGPSKWYTSRNFTSTIDQLGTAAAHLKNKGRRGTDYIRKVKLLMKGGVEPTSATVKVGNVEQLKFVLVRPGIQGSKNTGRVAGTAQNIALARAVMGF